MEKTKKRPRGDSAPVMSVGKFTSPLGLLDHLKRPEIKVDFVPVLDLAVIALLMSLLFTRFVMTPGVRIDLPETDLRMEHTKASVVVLTIGNNGILYFDGSVYEHSSIARAFEDHVKEDTDGNSVLLVKAEAGIELQVFLDLCQMAQAAGFSQVQIAGDKEVIETDLVPLNILRESSQNVIPVL